MQRNTADDLATLLAQAGDYLDPETRGIVPPIQPSTTFARDADYALGTFSYGRGEAPTAAIAEDILARLEGAEAAMLFGSGLAAATAVFDALPAGARVVAPRVMYHGLQVWLARQQALGRLSLSLYDGERPDALAEAVAAAPTALVWVETLANPTWDVVDLAAAAEIAHGAGARLAVDATVTPPVTCRPLEHGADVVFHSATKYLNGHSDVLGGVLATRVRDDAWAGMVDARLFGGGIIGAFEAWLLIRGMRTLALRFERASANAMMIAQQLDGHPALSAVLYPGLVSHPGHAIAARQMTGGFGGMLSLRVAAGEAAAREVAVRTRLFRPATSLGGVESLIEHRIAVEPPDSAVPRDLLRLSVGIEADCDLLADLDQALAGL